LERGTGESWGRSFGPIVLCRVEEERNILRVSRGRKANCIGHILSRNGLLKDVTEGKIKGRIEVTGRRGRRRKQLQYDLRKRKNKGT
jgi:hypothetical protein